jgi:hypothetical protein
MRLGFVKEDSTPLNNLNLILLTQALYPKVLDIGKKNSFAPSCSSLLFVHLTLWLVQILLSQN